MVITLVRNGEDVSNNITLEVGVGLGGNDGLGFGESVEPLVDLSAGDNSDFEVGEEGLESLEQWANICILGKKIRTV